MKPADHTACEGCGAHLPAGFDGGLCPRCLLAGGLESGDTDERTTIGPAGEETVSSDPARPSASPAESSGPLEQIGATIGRYRLLERIGEGGFGVVYLAEQTEPVKRKVALKVIKPGMDSREVIARFEAERQALALMDHPHIARVYDGGATESGRPYFVMELVRGVPITDHCAGQGLDVRARLALFTDVCAAVQHAHQKGIIHRDLKPSNILVSPHDGKPVVKVIDFGIAKAIGMELTEKTVFTAMGRMIGTPQYMSPEQAEVNAVDIDTRSDIYALGVVLYELLTGATPLEPERLRRAGFAEMQRLIREETPVKPSTRASAQRGQARTNSARRAPHSALPKDLDWIVMKALEKERARRYETANALAQDIGRHLRDEPVSAGPPSARYRLGKFVRRNRARLLAGAAAAAALLAGLAVSGAVWLDATLERRERVTRIEQQADALIGEAERQMALNAEADYEDDGAFRQAQQLALRVASLDGLGETDGAARARRDALLAAVASEERDRKLIAGIEEALMLQMGTGQSGSIAKMEEDAAAALAEAFTSHGTNPAESEAAEARAWLEPLREDVRLRILAGMLDWAALMKAAAPESAGHLREVLAAVDPDPWRRQLVVATGNKDRAALEAMAKSLDLEAQPLAAVLGLARALQATEARDIAEKVFRQAQREYPVNFWTNFALGTFLHHSKEAPAHRARGEGWSSIPMPDYRARTRRPEFDEAIGYLRAAVAANPRAVKAWVNLGGALHSGGDLDGAVSSLRRAIELDPDFALAHVNLGLALMNLGKHDEAIASYRRAIELDPDLAGAHVNLGFVLTQQGKLDEAVACLRRAIVLDPKTAVTHMNLGSALSKQGKFDEAVACHRRAIALSPNLAWAHLNLGIALGKQGKPDEAVASCLRAIELDPKLAVAHKAHGDVLFDQEKFDEAIASHRQAIALDPDLATAHMNLGNALWKHGSPEEAIASCRRALELDPDLADAHFNLGVALAAQDKSDQAVASYRRAIELDPDFAGAHVNLGNALSQQGKPDEAIVCFRRATELDPESAGAHVNLGLTLFEMGRPEEAIAAYRRAIELDPELAIAHVNLGFALTQQGKLDDAVACHRRALELDPDFVEAHVNLGHALVGQGNHEAAVASCLRAIELNPEVAEAHVCLGVAFKGQGKPEEAIASYRRAIALNPDLAVAHSNLGSALATQGKRDEAVAPLRRALELDPEDPKSSVNLSVALILSGDFAQAQATLNAARNVNDGIVAQATKLHESLRNAESRLTAILREKGADDPAVRPILREMSVQLPFPAATAQAIEAFRDAHREAVAAAPVFATVRTITLLKQGDDPAITEATQRSLARRIQKELAGGADFAELAREHSQDSAAKQGGLRGEITRKGLNKVLCDAAFSREVGAVGELIEDPAAFYLLRVDARRPGNTAALEDPGVRETVEALFDEERRTQWETAYLEKRRKRIAGEGTAPKRGEREFP